MSLNNVRRETVAEEIPPVCLEADICRIFKLTHRTLRRLRHHGAFPVPELPKLDRKTRWSGQRVASYLALGEARPALTLARKKSA